MKTIKGPILKQKIQAYEEKTDVVDFEGDFQTLRKGMIEMFQNADKSQKDEDAFYEMYNKILYVAD
ncbi:MAG: hypothetical protein ACI4T2_02190, partial [Christensenellales bacterium]